MASEPHWRYFFKLELLRHTGPGDYKGRWEMVAMPSSAAIGTPEIEELAWQEIRFHSTDNPKVIWASVPHDMGLETAAETIADVLGIVELEEDQDDFEPEGELLPRNLAQPNNAMS